MARVLVVEDNEDIRELVSMRLRAAGHRTVAVPDASAALATIADRGEPAVAVLDVGLPEMDGFELLTALRSRPGLEDLPAVFLTARVQEADVARGRALGAIYLTKPFVSSALINAVDQLVKPRPPADDW